MIPTASGYCDFKFPKWFGCVVASHENLAGGLIGAAGTLFAGWLAWTAVQTQIADARERAEADRKEVERLLQFDVDNIAEALGAMWLVLENIHHEETPENNETRLEAVKTGINFVADSIWIETTRSMIEILGWERRRSYQSLLNSLLELKKHENTTPENSWEIEILVTQAAGSCELLIPRTTEYFEGRFRRCPKAYSWGDAILMYADLQADTENDPKTSNS